MKSIDLDSTVVASSKLVSSSLGDQIAILGIDNGIYYGLDETGAVIWELIQQPITIRRLRDRLLNKYDVEPQRCQRELLALLEEMEKHRLVERAE